MDKNTYLKKYEELRLVRVKSESDTIDLIKEYISSQPYRIGDKVKVDDGCGVHVVYIRNISVDSRGDFLYCLDKSNKDGSRSFRRHVCFNYPKILGMAQ